MSRTPQEEAKLKLVLEMFEHVLNPMDSAAVDRFISPDYIQHNQMAKPGREGLKRFLDMIREQTPDAGDRGWAVIDIFRIESGMIAEHWDVMQDVVEGGPNPIGPF